LSIYQQGCLASGRAGKIGKISTSSAIYFIVYRGHIFCRPGFQEILGGILINILTCRNLRTDEISA
jgi:hypothetical protein